METHLRHCWIWTFSANMPFGDSSIKWGKINRIFITPIVLKPQSNLSEYSPRCQCWCSVVIIGGGNLRPQRKPPTLTGPPIASNMPIPEIHNGAHFEWWSISNMICWMATSAGGDQSFQEEILSHSMRVSLKQNNLFLLSL